MKVWYSPYKLFPKHSLNNKTSGSRSGFLIKIHDYNMLAGYADCHPWPEFGDETSNVQLKRLREGQFSEILKRTIYCAMIDGLARERNESLFDQKIKVRSHYTMASITELTDAHLKKILNNKFQTIKLKLGKNPEAEAKKISRLSPQLFKKLSWRLDFNGRGGEVFLKHADPSFLKCVEFIEDPEAFHKQRWNKIEKEFSVTLAFDQPAQGSENTLYKGPRVIKPARQSRAVRAQDILTSSMDHAVGQSFAFWQAQQVVKSHGKQKHDFGLQTQHLYKSNPFFDEIATTQPYFKFSEGTGLGFDDLLARQKWLSL